MTLLLGIDTGGTYTDAVILRDGPGGEVVASAKALTTHANLALGVADALSAVLKAGAVTGADISLVSVSTTLATNALVESQGSRVALVFAGFDPADATRAGLHQALDGDPLILIGGGHDTAGREVQPPDLALLDAALGNLPGGIDAFAVVSRFASRNTSHEIAIRDHLRDRTGLAVTCGHELSARLNGPLRAVTAVLNARLIGLISALIAAVEATLEANRIAAPLMLVRGDGALVSADFAKTRPIETILSGPAASLVGASALTGVADGVVADIGGTTTDIAILRDGRPGLNTEGAKVGAHRTMVEAVDMRAVGLGGDSQLHVDDRGLAASLRLGPRRVIPLSLLAVTEDARVIGPLQDALAADRHSPGDTEFVLATGRDQQAPGDPLEDAIRAELAAGPQPLSHFAGNRRKLSTVRKMIARGALRQAGFTPTDAAHVLGLHGAWNGAAARHAAELLARCRDGSGSAIAKDAESLARAVVEQLVAQSADAILGTALGEDGIELPEPGSDPLIRASRSGRQGAARIDIGLTLPLIGLGASAHIYYPEVAARLGTSARLPDLAGVANAVGAVSGKVSTRAEIRVSEGADGAYHVHHNDLPAPFATEDAALDAAGELAAALAHETALQAGADTPRISQQIERKTARIEGRDTLVEAIVRATATGRPRLAPKSSKV